MKASTAESKRSSLLPVASEISRTTADESSSSVENPTYKQKTSATKKSEETQNKAA
jgi:hypothetical protein